jgi:P-type Cu+ transporter
VTTAGTREHLDLDIEGMTCGSCAARIEKRLGRMDGVEASVNYATERASVSFDSRQVAPGDLIDTVRATGYEARLHAAPGAAETVEPQASDYARGRPTADQADDLQRRLAVSAVLALPVVLLSMVPALQFDYWQWIALVLTLPVVIWGGWPFHRAAWINLRHGAATMDTLISIGTLAALGWSLAALVFLGAGEPGMRMAFAFFTDPAMGAEHIYLEVAVAVTVLLLVGRWFEARAKRSAGSALRALLEMGAKEALLLEPDGRERMVAADRLAVGDRFIVRPGERIATDGVVEEGASAVDRSMLTGESVPEEVGPGDAVAGATINAGGRLVVRATRVGEDTALAQIARLVSAAQSGKAPVQRLADRVSAVFVPAVILLAAATLGFWIANGAGPAFAFMAAVAVLIIACPCALGLATPTALLVGTGRGAQMGILIRGPEILESTRRVDTILLDKTGTVTTGDMALVDLTVATGTDADEALRTVGALERASEHPVGRAIAAAARTAVPGLPAPRRFVAHAGLGVEGDVAGRDVLAGRPALIAERGMVPPADLQRAVAAAEAAGRTAVVGAWDGAPRAVFAVADTPKPSSAGAIARLRGLGLRPILLTGDNATTARAVAAAVGIDEVVAEVLPADKAEAVAALQSSGRVVAMVGDGVNDAPALAQADLGLAIGTGTDAAIEASDLTLVSGDLHAAADAIRLSRRTLATIKGNLFWAFAYNVAALPLAAAGYLNPVVAAAAMAASSLFVVSNSLRLRGFRPGARPSPPPAGRPVTSGA